VAAGGIFVNFYRSAKEYVSASPLPLGSMSIASTIALSGIRAATPRLQVSASNVANARSEGPGGAGALRVNQVATADGGTRATVSARSTATAPTYNVNFNVSSAEAWDFAANPYVALTNETVQQLLANFNLVANAHVLRADAQASATLLDITA
jgi:flagellar basal-body rod protein FlgC